MADDLFFTSIAELAHLFRTKEISPVELVDRLMGRIDRLNDSLGAYLSLNPQAESYARESQQRFQNEGPRSLLEGVPVSIKDIILTSDMKTSAGSRVFDEGLTADDAPCVAALKKAGAIVIGKTNLHEFAYGITNENEHYGPARNPWDLDRVAGGSSGGSAVALASGLCWGSLGTDTRGSIRIPAACCGVTGLKPTHSLISTGGILPLSRSLDHVGPMARSVQDIRFLLEQMVTRNDNNGGLRLENLRLGICPWYFESVHSEIATAINGVRTFLEAAGVQSQEVQISSLDAALEASGKIAGAEAVAWHEPFLVSHRDRYGPKVYRRLVAGYKISGRDLELAIQQQGVIAREFAAAFEQVDFLLAPGLTLPARRLGTEKVRFKEKSEPLIRAYVRLHAPQNMAGVPALVLPCGFTDAGLPLGVQLIGPRQSDWELLALGEWIQEETDWHRSRPEPIVQDG